MNRAVKSNKAVKVGSNRVDSRANNREVSNRAAVEVVVTSHKVCLPVLLQFFFSTYIVIPSINTYHDVPLLIMLPIGLNFLEQKTGHTLSQQQNDEITSGAKGAFQKFSGLVLLSFSSKVPVVEHS
jgi:hypothetical protein